MCRYRKSQILSLKTASTLRPETVKVEVVFRNFKIIDIREIKFYRYRKSQKSYPSVY